MDVRQLGSQGFTFENEKHIIYPKNGVGQNHIWFLLGFLTEPMLYHDYMTITDSISCWVLEILQ